MFKSTIERYRVTLSTRWSWRAIRSGTSFWAGWPFFSCFTLLSFISRRSRWANWTHFSFQSRHSLVKKPPCYITMLRSKNHHTNRQARKTSFTGEPRQARGTNRSRFSLWTRRTGRAFFTGFTSETSFPRNTLWTSFAWFTNGTGFSGLSWRADHTRRSYGTVSSRLTLDRR